MNVYILIQEDYEKEIKAVYEDPYSAQLGAIQIISEDLGVYGLSLSEPLKWADSNDKTVWRLTNSLYPDYYNIRPEWFIRQYPVTRIF